MLNGAFVTFPKGYDAYGHMSKIKFLVDNFPNAAWNSEWYSGQFFSEGSFPPLFHWLGAALVGWFGVSLESAPVVIGAASFVAITCALYGLVRVATGDVFAGMLASLLVLSANAFWAYILLGGLYPRILGMALLSLFAFFAVLHFKTGSPAAYAGAVLALAGALSSHLLLGAIGVALAVLMIAALGRTVGERLSAAVKLLVPTGLIVTYFYVPYLEGLARPSPVPLFTREYTAASLNVVLANSAAPLESLPLVVVPAAIVIPAFVYANRRVALPALGRRLMPVLALGGVGALVYALVGLPAPHLFIYNFQPGQALFFAAWFLAGLLGLASAAIGAAHLPRWILPALGILLLGYVAVVPTRLGTGAISADNPTKRLLQGALHVDPNDREHRIGVSWDAGSDWIDARYDVPQTRGYQQQGVIDADWQYWLESSVWSPSGNYEETNFLLDWYAIRSFYGGPDARVVQRFAARPDLYAPQDAGAQTFDFAGASPILSARSTRTALVIGGDAGYRYLLRALALSDFDSRSLIPVRGGEFVDDHSLAELRQFDLVVLYDFEAHDIGASMVELNQYVVGGGDVLIEANNSPLQAVASAPPPIPGSSISMAAVGPDWQLAAAAASPITAGIDLGGFAPAAYNGGPWSISYIPASSIAPWAVPVLISDGRPVMVAGTLGAGHVVWSGLNLPYHAASTRTPEESRLLASAITWAAPKQEATPTYLATFVDPALRRVLVTAPAAGVLFKENWVANWRATVNGLPASLYRAGPDFMYVPLPSGTTYPASAELAFAQTSTEMVADWTSAVSAIGLVVWVTSATLRRRRRTAS